jgi:hypothetical protein
MWFVLPERNRKLNRAYSSGHQKQAVQAMRDRFKKPRLQGTVTGDGMVNNSRKALQGGWLWVSQEENIVLLGWRPLAQDSKRALSRRAYFSTFSTGRLDAAFTAR